MSIPQKPPTSPAATPTTGPGKPPARKLPRKLTTAPAGAHDAKIPDPEAKWLDLGRVGRPHGTAGAVHVQLFNPDTEALDHTRTLRAYLPGKPAFLLDMTEARVVPGGIVACFRGVTDRSAASALTHAILSVDEAVLPPVADDEFYLADAMGAVVYDAASDARLGVVTGILATQDDLLDIRLDAGGSALVPVGSDAIESIGSVPGRIVIRDIEDWRADK